MSIKLTILGCGSSLGTPRIDGSFGNCNPKNIKNYRKRCSALISTKKFNLLIDTSPDLKSQLIENKITNIDRVLYTHMHADQTHGINDLRLFYLKNKKKIPVHADLVTYKYLKKTFGYCFKNTKDYPAIMKIYKLKNIQIYKDNINKIKIRAIKVDHGSLKSICYIFNDKCAYAPDVKKFFKKDLKYLKNLKYFIIDCLRYKKHPSHFNLDEVLKFVKIIKPKRTILTNLSSKIDFLEIKKKLPKNIVPAYDGLSLLI